MLMPGVPLSAPERQHGRQAFSTISEAARDGAQARGVFRVVIARDKSTSIFDIPPWEFITASSTVNT